MTAASSASTVSLGWLSNYFAGNRLLYGQMIFWMNLPAYIGATWAFHKAGKYYTNYMESCGPDAEVCDIEED